MSEPKEHKTFPAVVTGIDEEQGIVEHIVAVMGNLDEGNDIIHPGAFSKTINERGGKIRVLDHHQSDSVLRVIGKPLEIRELDKAQVPPQVYEKAPDATGALWVKTQYLLDTPEGLGAFKRIKAGAVDEYSIGYDPLDVDYSEVQRNGKTVTARNLRTIKLFEYSPVIFGMNPATTTLDAKSKDEPEDEKPYRAFREGDQWVVYKIDEEGQPVGDALGSHDSEEEAADQIRALYAAEEDDDEEMGKEARKEMTTTGPVRRFGDVVQGSLHRLYTVMCDDFYTGGYLSREQRIYLSSLAGEFLDVLSEKMPSEIASIVIPGMDGGMIMLSLDKEIETKAGRVLAARNAKRIMDAMRLLHEALSDAGLMDGPDDEEDSKSAPEGAALDTEHKAGPGESLPTSEMEDISALLREIEFEQTYLDIMEV